MDENLCLLHRPAEGIWPSKLDQINVHPRETDIVWRQRRLINKLNINQCVKVRLDRGETASVKNGRGVDKEAVCHRYYSTCTVNSLPRVWRLQNQRASNSHHEYADDLVLLAKAETMHDWETYWIGRCFIMETKWRKLRQWESDGNNPQLRLWHQKQL